MSISLLIYWVITIIMPAVNTASFKNGIIDPLVSNVQIESSDSYLSNEMAVSILRKDISPEQIINAKQYDGYVFDYNRCIQFNNRILCGYDKNKGPLLDDYTMIDIGNGCRARGDRIECGYDNPPYYKNLRQPAVKRGGRGKQDGHDKYGEHIAQHGDKRHRENNHHQRSHHHHGNKHHKALSRQAPTRTAAITDLTTPSIILNRMKPDYIENKSIKSGFSKIKIKTEETSIGSVLTNLSELTPSTTDTVKPLTTTVVIPTKQKSKLKSRSTRKTPISTTGKATTLTTKIIPTLPTSSESNYISDGETNLSLVRLKPVIKPKRRLLTELLSTIPKLVRKFKSKKDGNIDPKVANNGQTTINGAVLRMKTGSAEKKVKTACVEQQDRVVCYDFKT